MNSSSGSLLAAHDKSWMRVKVALVLVVSILVLLAAGCARSRTGTEASPQFTIQRLAPAVFFGESDPLPEVSVDDAQPFPANFLATTGQDGEAVITGQVDGATCRVFIFFDTRLQRSACNQAAADGNTTCLEEGSAVFENCHDHLVQTGSGEVKLLGTWASVTYLPDQKLTLLAVTEGETNVRAVLDDANQTMGEPVEVGAGQYYYTAPDQMLNPIAGAPPRQAGPLGQIGQILAQYPQAAGWIDLAMDRSRAYGVDPAQFEPTPTEPPAPTRTPAPIYTATQLAVGRPADELVIPRPEMATPPAIDGYCQEAAYGDGYLFRFRLSGKSQASGFLIQDDDWLYICGTYTSDFPAAGQLSIFLDPEGDGSLYRFANQGDYQLILYVATGEAELLAGNGNDGFTRTDEHGQDWLSAIPGQAYPQVLFEVALKIKGFAIGNCGAPFGLAMQQSGSPNENGTYEWPVGAIANRPDTWQKAVLQQPVCN